MRVLLLPALVSAGFLSTACSAQTAATATTAAVPAPIVTPLAKGTTTVTGQPLKLPRDKAEYSAVLVVIPPGGATNVHRHTWSRFAYVEQGPIRLINHDTGQTFDFQTGAVIAESVGQWHEGRAIGPNSVRLIVFDLVPPGAANVEAQTGSVEK
jgi:quercetin dioxygenase-like cupin family protein